MYFAETPINVTRWRSTTSNSIDGEGWTGLPSNSTIVALDASADTSQFHIIQPHVVK